MVIQSAGMLIQTLAYIYIRVVKERNGNIYSWCMNEYE